jgi:AhpD family alkylhydroperoxidase
MDEITKELIAIGVSVGVHCQPCLDYHLTKARELGIGDEAIRAAIEVGGMVEKGASSAMKKFVDQVMAPPTAQEGPCSPGSKSPCCG